MNIDLNQFAEQAYLIAKKRQENGAKLSCDTDKMLKHCATEVVEAQQAYDEWTYNSSSGTKEAFASELADIICCALIIAHGEGIDITGALVECTEKNNKRAELIGDKL